MFTYYEGFNGNQSKHQAFYIANQYTPLHPVTGANVGKWYIPTDAEWKQVLTRYGALQNNFIGNLGTAWEWPSTNPNDYGVWNKTKFDAYFTNVSGATAPRITWPTGVACVDGSALSNGSGICYVQMLSYSGNDVDVRPFVHF